MTAYRLLLLPLILITAEVLADDAPKKSSAIDTILDQRKLNADFQDRFTEDIIEFFADISGLSIHFDPSATALSKKISIKLENAPLRALLQEVEKQSGIKAKLSCGVLVFGSKKALENYPTKAKRPKTPKAKDAAALKVTERRLSLRFDATPLTDCCDFLKRVTGLDVLANDTFKVNAEVTIRAKISIFDFLTLLACSQGGSVAIEDGQLVLLGPKKKP